MDTIVLPAIVFRQAQDTRAGPGANWRKELRVRPLAPDALSGAASYADRVDLAGWLVDEYRDRGGDGLAKLLADVCGHERSLQGRLEQLQAKLGAEHPAVVTSQGSGYPEETVRADSVEDVTESSDPGGTGPETLVPEDEEAPVGPQPSEEVPSDTVPAAAQPSEEVPSDTVPAAAQPEADGGHRPPGEPDPVSRRVPGVDPGNWDTEAVSGSGARSTWPGPERDTGSGQPAQAGYRYRSWTVAEVASQQDGRGAPVLPQQPGRAI